MPLFSVPAQGADARKRRKDYDRDKHSPRSKDKAARKVSSNSNQDFDTPSAISSTSSSRSQSARKSKPDFASSQMDRRGSTDSPLGGRSTSLPYPSFSKAHSREAVANSADQTKPANPLTPDPTDISRSRSAEKPTSNASAAANTDRGAPPSPPLTANEYEQRQGRSSSAAGYNTGPAISKSATTSQSKFFQRAGDYVYGGKSGFSASRASLREAEEGGGRSFSTQESPKPLSKTRYHGSQNSGGNNLSPGPSPTKASEERKTETRPGVSSVDSNATYKPPSRASHTSLRPTSIETNRRLGQQTDRVASPNNAAVKEAKPPHYQSAPSESIRRPAASSTEIGQIRTSTSSPGAVPPPPPPPAPAPNPAHVPRVDYLLLNGGLLNPVSTTFSSNNSQTQNAFAPYHELLDSFSKVMSKNGSVAVATGYRSVARRLLDRLEAVFARNISSEICQCAMCLAHGEVGPEDVPAETGVSWGEVLELVSGRRDLPSWPPFSLQSSGLGIDGLEQQETPMQKLDVDVPEEYREHYIRQSKKTKQAVQNWLAAQPEEQPAAPQEADDETLIFAMLTYLEPEQRRTFTALLRGASSIPEAPSPIPSLQSPTPAGSQDGLMYRIGFAIQRLYRLNKRPRDPECCMFLLKNPDLHNALATLAAISQQEWEILISGRFDGFLWSGAEDLFSTADVNAPGPRSFSPIGTGLQTSSNFPYRHATNPSMSALSSSQAATAGPVQIDEDTEIAALAEVEREIYAGMETLEDAFEILHLKAEAVRQRLRERSAGLSILAQGRRSGDKADGPEARLDTPALNGAPGSFSGRPGDEGTAGEGDWMQDLRSELAPDDSASNVGFRDRERRRRKKRTPGGSGKHQMSERDRKTPVVPEEDEGIEKVSSSRLNGRKK